MKIYPVRRVIFEASFRIILCLLFSNYTYAQQLPISDFVIYGGNSQCINLADCGVSMTNSEQIIGGKVGSYSQIKTLGPATFSSDLLSGGLIDLAANNTVDGKIMVVNLLNYPFTTPVLKTANNALLKKDLDINGSVNIANSGSSVLGKATLKPGSTYTGPDPSGGKFFIQPTIPSLPLLPPITTFPKAANGTIKDTREIVPGNYGSIELSGGKTLTFKGTGVYVFSAIKNSGSVANNFILDFQNDPTGKIKIYVHGDVDLNFLFVTLKNGGSAFRVFTEVHGNGSTSKLGKYSFTLANFTANGRSSEWLGTVYATSAGISIGTTTHSSNITGALWSVTKVNLNYNVKVSYAPFIECQTPNANAGTDVTFTCPQTQIALNGSSSTPNVSYAWQALDGGHIVSGESALNPIVNKGGRYVLTVTSNLTSGCLSRDTVLVTNHPCINPLYPPPGNGKDTTLIGSELRAVAANPDSLAGKDLVIIKGDSVWVEVIVLAGKFPQALVLLQSGEFGMTNIISNGNSQFIITGRMPIVNVTKLIARKDLFNYARPLFQALKGVGIATTQGDLAQRSNFLRNAYGLDGDSIKVGVLSDSFNTLPGNPAQVDVNNGDLPGGSNPVNDIPVQVLREYPFGRGVDEGRAMLQIIHDVAPKASLAFRTGFISAGDLAQGIRELRDAHCDVIVDDITFITEPFFQEGVVAQAVNEVSSAGVSYFTSAGNFGNKSYQATFNPAPAPPSVFGTAHNFGGGDILQEISLEPGNYTIVLQWQDPIYSLGQIATGTLNDLDIFLSDNDGTTLFGFNRNNLGGDPLEILPFTVLAPTTTNILISRAAGTGNVSFKYIIFRGNATINEYNTGNSTIVGQANAANAFTIGAVRYNQTPSGGVNPPLIENYSSHGRASTAVQKPDFTAPDGVNTSVDLGPDFDHDGLHNFFGTSAAAPHAAAVAALLKQARHKYYNENYSNADLKTLLRTTALDMYTPGFDSISGHGFIQADAAIQSFAAATPALIRLIIPENANPGVEPFELTVRASYLSPSTKVLFRNDTLETTILNDSTAVVQISEFTGNPIIRAWTGSITPSGRDGGISNSISIFDRVKRNITVKADNKTMKYGEKLPQFTATIRVDNVRLDSTGLSLADIGLAGIEYTTPATSTSNVNNYIIKPSRTFDENNPDDAGFMELYNYTFSDGFISVQKLPIEITPEDITLTYGEKIQGIQYTYNFDPTAVLNDPAALLNSIKSDYQEQLASDYIGLINGKAVTIVNGKAVTIVNGQDISFVNGKAVTIVNGQTYPIINPQSIQVVNGKAVTIVNNLTDTQTESLSFLASAKTLEGARQITNKKIVNGTVITETSKVVDITQESVLDFNDNSAQTNMLTSVTAVSPKGLIDIEAYTSKQAVTIVNGKAVTIVNGAEITEVNGKAVTIVNGKAVTIVNGQPVPIVSGNNRTAVILDEDDIGGGLNGTLKSLNMVTGMNVGVNYLFPGSLSDDNLLVTYNAARVTVLPAPITIMAQDISKIYGQAITLDSTAFIISQGVLQDRDTIKTVNLSSTGTAANATGGSHPIIPSNAIGSTSTDLSNYTISYINGTLLVGKVTLTVKANNATKVYGDPHPAFTANFSDFVNDETLATSGITGQPGFSTTAGLLSNVASYPISVNQGTLSSSNYTFNFVSGGSLTITKAPLQVKSQDVLIIEKDPLPVFTSTFTTLKAGENPTVSYTVTPTYADKAGTYTIIPLLVNFSNAGNYNITYLNGILTVLSPTVDNRKLRIYLDCVEDVKGPATYKFIAHFSVINTNTVTITIPKGKPNNFISAEGIFDDTQLPSVFPPGTIKFNIPFDGKKLTWNLITIESGKSTAMASTASNRSGQCKVITPVATATTSSSREVSMAETLTVYPNPTQTRVTLTSESSPLSSNKSVLYDLYGQFYPIKITQVISDKTFEIDVSGLSPGLYYLKVNTGSSYQIGRIIKE